jgi:hypothetical protein
MKLTDILTEFSTPRIVPSTYLVGDIVSQEEFALMPGTRMYTTKDDREGAKTIDGAIWRMDSMTGKWRKIKNGPVPAAITEDRSDMPEEYPNFDRKILENVYLGLRKSLDGTVEKYVMGIKNYAEELSEEYGNFDKLDPTRKNEYKRDCAMLKRVIQTTIKQVSTINEFMADYHSTSNLIDDLTDLEEQLEDVIGSK